MILDPHIAAAAEVLEARVTGQPWAVRDPVASFTTVGPDGRHHEFQERLIQSVANRIEVLGLGGNRMGKTRVGAALAGALAQCRGKLAGIKLPPVSRPSVGVVFTEGWKQQIESTQQTILEMLGDWPHVVRYSSQVPLGAQLVLVKPDGWGSDDERTWSRIWFHVRGDGKGTSIEGINPDWGWADEPPSPWDWREFRMRSRGNVMPLRWITMTPKWVEDWEPILRDFDGCEHQPSGGRLLLRASVYENPFLTADHIQEREQAVKGDEHERARLYGEPVDVTGDCPFPGPALDRWAAQCKPPKLVEVLDVLNERETPTGVVREKHAATYEIYRPSNGLLGASYCNVDPSLGINDGKHDPGGIHIYDREALKDMQARFKGFLPPFALGFLAGLMCRAYPNTPIKVENNDGFWIAVMRGARAAGHTEFSWTTRENRLTGQIEPVAGWRTNEHNRAMFIGEILSAMADGRLPTRSAGVVQTLRRVQRVRGNSRRAEGPGDEDMILLGEWLYSAPALGEWTRAPVSEFSLILQKQVGDTFTVPQTEDPDEGWWR